MPPLFEFRVDDAGRHCAARRVLLGVATRNRVDTKLRASEARFRTFVDHATDAFFAIKRCQFVVLDVNRQARASLGYSRKELIGMHTRDFDSGLDAVSIERMRERILAGETVTLNLTIGEKTAPPFPVKSVSANLNKRGRRLLCLVRDITERKLAEDELRASEVRFRSLVDHATDGFFLMDEHQAILEVTGTRVRAWVTAAEEMIGMHPRDFDAGLDAASVARIRQRVMGGETVTFETLHRRKDGSVFPVEVRARQFQHGPHRFRLVAGA